MIAVVVSFSIRSEVNASILEEKFLETAPIYLETRGLVRKNFLYDRAILETGGGGVMLFRTRQALNYSLMKKE